MFSLFVGAIVAHWMFSFGGVVLTALAIIEKLRHKDTKVWVFWGAALTCLFISCYGAWTDEHHNAQDAMYGKDGKSEAWAKYNTCDKERYGKTVLVDSLGAQVSSLQTQLGNQQYTFNKCILALGVEGKPRKPTISVYSAKIMGQITTVLPQGREIYDLWSVIAITDVAIMPARGVLHCANKIVLHEFDLALPARSINARVRSTTGRSTNSISDTEVGFQLESPAWNESNPLVFGVAVEANTYNGPGLCSITLSK